jgi:hypothetical protein
LVPPKGRKKVEYLGIKYEEDVGAEEGGNNRELEKTA